MRGAATSDLIAYTRRYVCAAPDCDRGHIAGFDLHANVAVPAADRARLEQLCRYLLRPAVAQDRLRLLDDGRVVLTLKTAWTDGTQCLVFAPLERLERLAAITPRPRIYTTSSRRTRAGAPALSPSAPRPVTCRLPRRRRSAPGTT